MEKVVQSRGHIAEGEAPSGKSVPLPELEVGPWDGGFYNFDI